MAIRQDDHVRQGETWTHTHVHRTAAGIVNLTGYTARMMVKAGFRDSSQAYLSTGSDTQGGSIVLGGSAGTIIRSMSAAQTEALADSAVLIPTEEVCDPTLIYRYDLEITSPAGVVTRVLEGRFFLHRGVTV